MTYTIDNNRVTTNVLDKRNNKQDQSPTIYKRVFTGLSVIVIVVSIYYIAQCWNADKSPVAVYISSHQPVHHEEEPIVRSARDTDKRTSQSDIRREVVEAGQSKESFDVLYNKLLELRSITHPLEHASFMPLPQQSLDAAKLAAVRATTINMRPYNNLSVFQILNMSKAEVNLLLKSLDETMAKLPVKLHEEYDHHTLIPGQSSLISQHKICLQIAELNGYLMFGAQSK